MVGDFVGGVVVAGALLDEVVEGPPLARGAGEAEGVGIKHLGVEDALAVGEFAGGEKRRDGRKAIHRARGGEIGKRGRGDRDKGEGGGDHGSGEGFKRGKAGAEPCVPR